MDDLQKKTLVFSQVSQPELEGIAEVVPLASESFAENWTAVLDEFAKRGVHRLAVETGATLAQNILDSGLWNRFFVLQSSRKLGTGLSWRSGKEPEDWGEDSLWTALHL